VDDDRIFYVIYIDKRYICNFFSKGVKKSERMSLVRRTRGHSEEISLMSGEGI